MVNGLGQFAISCLARADGCDRWFKVLSWRLVSPTFLLEIEHALHLVTISNSRICWQWLTTKKTIIGKHYRPLAKIV